MKITFKATKGRGRTKFFKVNIGAIEDRYEGTPNMVMEALAQDCSVILSDVECHRQYFPSNVVQYVEVEDYSADALYQHSFNSIDVKAFVDDWTENKMVSEYTQIINLIS